MCSILSEMEILSLSVEYHFQNRLEILSKRLFLGDQWHYML